jgi:hypothetical protein
MRTRTLTGLAAALTAGGIVTAVIGAHVTHTLPQVIGGLALATAAIPTALTAHGRQAAALTAAERAAERTAGYRQGLMHAALGLLDPTPSTRVDNDDTDRTQQ